MAQIKIPTPLIDALTVEGKQREDASKILKGLNIDTKVKPTKEQIVSVTYCCSLMDNGIAVDAAIEQTLSQYSQSAIAVAEQTAVVPQELPQAQQAGIDDVTQALVPELPDINLKAVEAAERVDGAIDQACQTSMVNAVFGEESPIKPDPKKAVELFRQRKAEREQR